MWQRRHSLGRSAVVYTRFENGSGVIPNDLSDPEVFTGGEITGNVCWEIMTTDAQALQMLLQEPAFSFRGDDRMRLAIQ